VTDLPAPSDPGAPRPDPSPAAPVGPTSEERTWALFAHLTSLLAYLACGLGFLGPLVVWLLRKDRSEFVDFHGKESMNFQVTMFLLLVVVTGLAVLLGVVTCGLSLWLVAPAAAAVTLLDYVLAVVAGVRAYNGKRWRYPISFRFIR
jgi:uncharacterized protein